MIYKISEWANFPLTRPTTAAVYKIVLFFRLVLYWLIPIWKEK